MSNLDTFLNVDQSISLRGLRKLSKGQLLVALNNNEQLVKLRSQLHAEMASLNTHLDYQSQAQNQMLLLQKQQLKNQQEALQIQIKEIESRQLQKFHRERIVKCKEIVEDFKSSTDLYIQKVFIKDFIQPAEVLIDESRRELEEIADKEYCLKLKNEFRQILSNHAFENIELPEMDTLLESKSKLDQIQSQRNTASQTVTDSATFLENFNRSKTLNKSVLKTKMQIPIRVIVSVLTIIVIMIGVVQDGAGNVPGLIYLVLPFCFYIIFKFYWLKKKTEQLKIASDIEEQKTNENVYKIVEDDKVKSENEIQSLKKEESKLISSFRHLYSEVIYNHPEFLKFEYLLDLYKV